MARGRQALVALLGAMSFMDAMSRPTNAGLKQRKKRKGGKKTKDGRYYVRCKKSR